MIEYYTMNNRFIPLVNLLETYEAYLYIVVFQHNKSMKYYFGYHEGLFDGTYKGTPKAHEEEFMEDLGKYDYKVYALEVGDVDKIIFMEKIMLNNLKKKSPQPKDYPILPSSDWTEFYNEAIGGGAKLKNCSTGVEDIQNAVDNEDWNTLRRAKEDKNVIRSWQPAQVRYQWLILSHVSDLKIQIKDTDGKWLDSVNEKTGKPNFKGVLVLEDRNGKGKHLRIGSNHTVEAVKNIKQVKELWVIFVPKHLHKDLGESDIIELGQWDNPQDEMPHIPTPEDQHIDWIVKSCFEKDIKPDHFSFFNKLKRQNLTSQKIRSLCKKAKGRLEDKQEFAKTGTKQIDWDTPIKKYRKNQKLLKAGKPIPKKNIPQKGTREYEFAEIMNSYKGTTLIGSVGDQNKIVVEMSDMLMKNILKKKKDRETNFRILAKNTIRDGAKKVNTEWGKLHKPHLLLLIEHLWLPRFEKDIPDLTIEIDDYSCKFDEPDTTFETLN